MSSGMTQIYIALFEQPGSRHHHLAFLTSPDGKLFAGPDRVYQLSQAIKEADDANAVFTGWKTHHGRLSIQDGSLDNIPVKMPLCCIALPPIVAERRLATAQWWLESLPAEQGDTALMEHSDGRWSATQWVLRGVDTLVAAGILPDKWVVKYPEPGVIDFKHPSWKQLLALAIAHRGDEAMQLGPLITEIRILEL